MLTMELPKSHKRTPRRRLRLAYLTTEYPKVSHTFIRREILELERRGHDVVRLSIRMPSAPLVDPSDREEQKLTYAVLGESRVRLILGAISAGITRPASFARALQAARAMSLHSDRGHLRHLAYLVEAIRLGGILKRKGVRHVHVHFGTNAASVARLMKILFGISYSLTIHGPGEFDASIGHSLREKVADSTFTLAISHYCKAQLMRWTAPDDWEKIHVIHCTVNPEFLHDTTPVSSTADTLVCVGRLTPQKGQLLLLEAFAQAVADGKAGRLIFAGDGELRATMEARIAELNLSDRVTITGWVTESQVRALLKSARALALPSFAEGLPVVIMEAFAMGRPVITTHVAAIPELVRHQRNGWLVPAGDVQRLARCLALVLTLSEAKLTAMGLYGRRFVASNHHPFREGRKLEALFNHYVL